MWGQTQLQFTPAVGVKLAWNSSQASKILQLCLDYLLQLLRILTLTMDIAFLVSYLS